MATMLVAGWLAGNGVSRPMAWRWLGFGWVPTLSLWMTQVRGYDFRPVIVKSQKVDLFLDLDSGVSWCITRAHEAALMALSNPNKCSV